MRTEIGKRKALPAALLCFCIAAVFYLSAPTAFAAPASKVYVGSTEVTGYSTPQTPSGCTGTVQYDEVTGTLTLNGVTVPNTNSHQVIAADGFVAISANGDLTIELVGANTVTGPDTHISSQNSYGVYVFGSLTMQGTGSLTATGGTAATSTTGGDSYGVWAGGATTVSSGSLKGYGGTGLSSHGVYAGGETKVSGTGSVEGTGGESTGTGGESTGTGGSSRGVWVASGAMTVSGSGSVKGTGGEATEGDSYGVYASSGLTVSDTGRVEGKGGKASETSCGVMAGDTVTVSGGSMSGTGGEAGNNSRGVHAHLAMKVSGGSVTGTGGAGQGSCGVFAFNTLDVSGTGSLTGAGGSAGVAGSMGVFTLNTLTVSGGDLVGRAGTDTSNNSCGVQVDTTRGSISISSGSIIAVGNNHSFDKSPVTLPTTTYYHRASDTTTPPSDYRVTPLDADYAWANAQKYAEITTSPTPSVELTGGSATFIVGGAPSDAVFAIGKNIPGTFDATTNYLRTEVGGTTLKEPDEVSAEDGSIILTFSRAYLNTLPVGTHTATVHLQGAGFVNATVPIQLVVNPVPSPSPGRANPSTGVGETTLWTALAGFAAFSAAGITAFEVKKRRAKTK